MSGHDKHESKLTLCHMGTVQMGTVVIQIKHPMPDWV